jgi:UDP-N-acetyl-D-mannosaminuronate dehydrogenase
MNIENIAQIRLAVIGLGYVGLPLAVEFGKPQQVLYDLKYVLPRDAADLRL